MARSIFAGTAYDLAVAQDSGNSNALILRPNTAVPLYDAGGNPVTDFLVGVSLTTPATSISTDANGYIAAFKGPDGVTALYMANGIALLSRDAYTGGAGTVTSTGITDSTAVGRSVLTAADATAARAAIGAGTSNQNLGTITTAQIITGTATTAVAVTAAALSGAGLGFSNYYVMPVWDGSGSHPVRPAGLPSFFVVKWRQPTAPIVSGTTYAVEGDEWAVTN